MSDTDTVKAAKRVKKAAALKRVFLENGNMNSDFFVLKPAKMVKVIGALQKGESLENYANDATMVQRVDHQHFFYTFDPDGKEQVSCTHIGGHFHMIEVEYSDKEDEPCKVLSVSGPMKWARKKVAGKFKKVVVPAMGIDQHTHDIEYIKTDVIKRRKINAEVAKIQTAEANKTSHVPGIK